MDDSKLKREAAEKIYLQLCDDSMSEWYLEITWCKDRIHDEDIAYIREDIVEGRIAELERMNRQLAADIVPFLLEQKNLEQQRDELLGALKNIADAEPRKWEEEVRDQFQEWAQNRARHAIANAERKK